MTLQGSCHCGKTRFELSAAPTELTRCTCSLCSKRGALWAYCTPDEFRLLTPPDDVATYRWNSRMIANHYCDRCGCSTYTESPSWVDFKPDFDHPKIGVNARLLDGFDLDAVPVTVLDGKNLW